MDNVLSRKSFWLVVIFILTGAFSVLNAAERGGLVVKIENITVMKNERRDILADTTPVDRTISLKVDVSNKSTSDMAATTLEYVVLIQRGSDEFQRYEGSKPLDALAINKGAKFALGDFHIGGEIKGAFQQRMDHLAGWKVVINRDGKKLEFTSSSNFEYWNSRAHQ